MFTHSLPNTGVVVVDGSPRGGWTMESWDGMPVPQASLPTSLFVDVRNFIRRHNLRPTTFCRPHLPAIR